MTRRLAPLAILLASVTTALAAPAARFDPRDLTGVWERSAEDGRGFDPSKGLDDQTPPFKPAWAAEWRTIRQRARAGMRVWDPTFRCLPPGMPRTMSPPYPFEIMISPGRVTMMTEFYNETRRIWTDGRRHPAGDELEPTFSGHSIGHWEGDTLVIDTVGLRHETVVDTSGIPHSDQLRVVERVRRDGADKLAWTISLIDPVVLERPWTVTKTFLRSSKGTEVREYVCAENNQEDVYAASPDDARYAAPDPRLKTLP